MSTLADISNIAANIFSTSGTIAWDIAIAVNNTNALAVAVCIAIVAITTYDNSGFFARTAVRKATVVAVVLERLQIGKHPQVLQKFSGGWIPRNRY